MTALSSLGVESLREPCVLADIEFETSLEIADLQAPDPGSPTALFAAGQTYRDLS